MDCLSRSTLLLVLVFGLACAQTTLPPYPIRAAADYATAQQRGDLVVAVEPVVDAELSERTLGSDLVADEQVLAILVVVENRGRAQSFLVRSEDVQLVDADAMTPDPERGNPLSGRVAEAAAGAPLAVGSFFPPLLLVSVPASIAMGRNLGDSRVSRHLLVRSEWSAHTISPGERESGFVYLPLAGLDPSLRKVDLGVRIRDLGRDADESFEFEIPLPEIVRKD